jgi:hypothetical protein
MRIGVDFEDGRVEFDASVDRLVAAWEGPAEPPVGPVLERVREALERPLDYPPLRQVVVPGDRVVVPLDLSLPDADAFLIAIAEILASVGVESTTVIVDGRIGDLPSLPLPPGVDLVVHDPANRESLAYLASTELGRRIYLNRRLADADCVVPVGRFGFDDALGYLGPWTVIEPGLSDATPSAASLLAPSSIETTGPAESAEVSWLLGSQFQVGGIPGRSGILEVVAGLTESVRARAATRLESAWKFTVDDRADLVIAGLGGPGRPARPSDLAAGLRQALRLGRRGGKVALLSRLSIEAIREAVRGRGQPQGDWEKANGWADLYLASAADPDEVEELGFIPLDRPEHAVKLASLAHSYITIGQADRTRAVLSDEGLP